VYFGRGGLLACPNNWAGMPPLGQLTPSAGKVDEFPLPYPFCHPDHWRERSWGEGVLARRGPCIGCCAATTYEDSRT